jgi:hypothetical protein
MKLDNSTRILHYDIARGAYLKPEYFMEAVKMAANAGFTHFLPYLENMLSLKSAARQSPECAYSIQQMQQFLEYGKSMGIEIIPHFNVLGHTKELVKAYPFLAADASGELDITREETLDFMLSCLKEVIPLCTSGNILIGGDEWLLPAPLANKPDFNTGFAIAEYLNKIILFLKAFDVKPLLWHDMLLHYPEAIEQLSKDVIILFWIYDIDSEYPLLDYLRERGFEVILAPGLCDWPLSKRRYDAVRKCQEVSREKNIPLLMTCWEIVPWNIMQQILPFLGRLFRGTPLPDTLIEQFSLLELCKRFENCSELKKQFAKRLSPEIFAPNNSVKAFKKYHYATGPLFENFSKLSSVSHANKTTAPQISSNFDLRINTDSKLGDIIEVSNGDEKFNIYPKFGMSLQAWQKGRQWIIDNQLEEKIDHINSVPGGYRSYSAVGGLRPVASLGSWHNPCIIWNFSYIHTTRHTQNEISICGTLNLYHIKVECIVKIKKGHPGFEYGITAENLLDHAAVFRLGFNFPLSIPSQAWDNASFNEELFQDQSTSLIRLDDSQINISYGTQNIKIIAQNPSDGIWMDWSNNFVTPDFRAPYVSLKPHETTSAKWLIEIKNNPKDENNE